ncbi:MAG: hypothetical protein V7K48_06235 [Nostoc sp.]|uniref:hypothetical protein n=1 Tax=Nostoc sp. TaxID=1180 RepID=UPI002FF7F174
MASNFTLMFFYYNDRCLQIKISFLGNSLGNIHHRVNGMGDDFTCVESQDGSDRIGAASRREALLH